jgi:two-component system, NtrC family, response regulator HydG
MDKKSILVIDNDKGILSVLWEILTLEGYKVDTAESGREAIQKCRFNFYNVALIDIRLSDTDGVELLDALREDAPKTIKIMMTGYPTIENAVEALNKGANSYIVKPINPEELIKLVAKKLRAQEEEEDVDQDRISEWIEDRMRRLETITKSEQEPVT